MLSEFLKIVDSVYAYFRFSIRMISGGYQECRNSLPRNLLYFTINRPKLALNRKSCMSVYIIYRHVLRRIA